MFNVHCILGCLALAFTTLFGASEANATDEKTVNRYPYDPACTWGRLADGRGMVVRCLTQAEAIQLSSSKPAAGTAATTAGTAAAGAGTPATSTGTPATAGVSVEPTEKKNPTESQAEPVDVEVASVTADEGQLPLARRKLRTPRDKYARCVSDNGGLSAEVGEVTVRFLVRERGRAEGTNVEKRQGVGEAAAKCIAGVVDRRPVGTPEAPVVGATAVFRVTKLAKRK
jgi:hypothetical protein